MSAVERGQLEFIISSPTRHGASFLMRVLSPSIVCLCTHAHGRVLSQPLTIPGRCLYNSLWSKSVEAG